MPLFYWLIRCGIGVTTPSAHFPTSSVIIPMLSSSKTPKFHAKCSLAPFQGRCQIFFEVVSKSSFSIYFRNLSQNTGNSVETWNIDFGPKVSDAHPSYIICLSYILLPSKMTRITPYKP